MAPISLRVFQHIKHMKYSPYVNASFGLDRERFLTWIISLTFLWRNCLRTERDDRKVRNGRRLTASALSNKVGGKYPRCWRYTPNGKHWMWKQMFAAQTACFHRIGVDGWCTVNTWNAIRTSLMLYLSSTDASPWNGLREMLRGRSDVTVGGQKWEKWNENARSCVATDHIVWTDSSCMHWEDQ